MYCLSSLLVPLWELVTRLFMAIPQDLEPYLAAMGTQKVFVAVITATSHSQSPFVGACVELGIQSPAVVGCLALFPVRRKGEF